MFSFGKRAGTSPPSEGQSNIVNVGWVMDPTWEATVIWGAPRKLTRPEARSTHAKGVSVCPAINDHEARVFEIASPIDIHLRSGRDANGELTLGLVDGDQSTIRPAYLNNLIKIMPKAEWRHPNRPMFQIATPYYFVADEPVYITWMPPFYHFAERPVPGLVFGGRFPIHIWPRQTFWAFEWYDPAKDIMINRGDPWFYVNFETSDPSRHVRMIEGEMTKVLSDYLKELGNVTSYVNKTFSLFKTAEQRRPKTLLTPKQR